MANCVDPMHLLSENVGFQIHCDLRTNQSVRGKLCSCDRFMNLVVSNATLSDRSSRTETTVRECTIRGTSIRALHLSNDESCGKEPAVPDTSERV
ncbi:Ribonucleoprotein LSM domain eukaryotic/archaea-type [Perkinsela sp. CCAP 1560/4]|nr:Ribonucleoprotein LSM domain eukaryotic/archaea-type [Perkinsela sp. CCAP 1560/4]|eukprot:KNH05470.1 Ribonucleoprotein LSM domain eukaryotic/archaea-type [Perkinsela sp. CCAP 1560/4]